MKKFSFRASAILLAALCFILFSGSSCHRRATIVKYGGPPADYKTMDDTKSLHHDGVKKV